MTTTLGIDMRRTVIRYGEDDLYYGAIHLAEFPYLHFLPAQSLLALTCKGFMSPRSAAREINKINLEGVALLDEEAFPEIKIPPLHLRLTVGTEIILVTPHDEKEKQFVQFLKGNECYDTTTIVPKHLYYLLAMKKIAIDSIGSSGVSDPDLSARYDVYIVTSPKQLELI